jgi:hypothetical protein
VFGLSDFFFTFTCNPKWPEIVNNFYSAEQRPSDKSDVIVRVYHMKLQDIKSRKMFRPCRAGTIIFKLYFFFVFLSKFQSSLYVNRFFSIGFPLLGATYNSYTVLYTIEFQKRGLPHGHIIFWVPQNQRQSL